MYSIDLKKPGIIILLCLLCIYVVKYYKKIPHRHIGTHSYYSRTKMHELFFIFGKGEDIAVVVFQ